ncbi:MAG TPA: hypothetical protein PKE55_15275, partial [Kiritimatiellia bacterium]|nr:hypothetical protein [Kiritimatiellia bacterium]
ARRTRRGGRLFTTPLRPANTGLIAGQALRQAKHEAPGTIGANPFDRLLARIREVSERFVLLQGSL